jgi:hypothetical protein
MYVINMKNKQKEWHPATKPLKNYQCSKCCHRTEVGLAISDQKIILRKTE